MMLSLQETRETVALNALMTKDSLDYQEIHEFMCKHFDVFTGFNVREQVKEICVSLSDYFKSMDIRLFKQVVLGHRYNLTDKAREYIVNNLLEPIYDENGEYAGKYFQHPATLNLERMELI